MIRGWRAVLNQLVGFKITEKSKNLLLALLNPDFVVYVIFTSSIHEIFLYSTKLCELLSTYKNIRFRFVNIFEFYEHTPLKKWIKSQPYWSYTMEEIGDVMRLMMLGRYGGKVEDFHTKLLNFTEFYIQVSP